jgi:hypothetical protein
VLRHVGLDAVGDRQARRPDDLHRHAVAAHDLLRTDRSLPVWESSSGRFRVQLSRTADKPEKSVLLLAQSAACFSFRGSSVGLLVQAKKL